MDTESKRRDARDHKAQFEAELAHALVRHSIVIDDAALLRKVLESGLFIDLTRIVDDETQHPVALQIAVDKKFDLLRVVMDFVIANSDSEDRAPLSINAHNNINNDDIRLSEALYLACLAQQWDIVRQYTERERRAGLGKRAGAIIGCAARDEQWDIVQQELEVNGHIELANARSDRDHLHVLLWAARHKSAEMTQLLLDRGADVGVRDEATGETALTIILRNASSIHNGDESSRSAWRAVSSMVVQDKILMTRRWKLLMSVVVAERPLTREEIEVQHGEHSKTPLIMAAEDGEARVVDVLLKAGASKRHEALTAACRAGHVDVVSRLLQQQQDEEEAESKEDDERANEAVQVACRSGHAAVVQALLSKHEKRIDWLRTVDNDGCDKQKLLFDVIDDAAVRKLVWSKALFRYVSDGNADALERLMPYVGKRPEYTVNVTEEDRTLAMAAVQHVWIVKMLHEAGCDLSARDARGWSVAMHAAANPNATDCLMFLLNVSARGNDDVGFHGVADNGMNALMVASKEGVLDNVRALLTLGDFDLAAETADGHTAQQLAANDEVAKVFDEWSKNKHSGKEKVLSRRKRLMRTLSRKRMNSNGKDSCCVC
eukprot:TRINITY_DN35997_c0_g1_i1.p1 TRINITY_DN35997_c0_g1~~TRINITY_DN35997_c0_g1_i1.p1  ORF type:complete len:702 (-),score=383.98 TRINITY_DN35997_c0_g1_i1:308-2119(-)